MESKNLPIGRLIWLVGPPGAGKSTFSRLQDRVKRVVELTDMLGPLVNEEQIRRGVLTANGRLVRLIRELEIHQDNIGRDPLLIVAGLVPEDALFPLGSNEVVWLLRPGEERWRKQLRSRPKGGGSSGQYDDYKYSELWYERFSEWDGRPGVFNLECDYDESMLGILAGQ